MKLDSLGAANIGTSKDKGKRPVDGCNIGGANVVIPLAVVDDMCSKFDHTLCGYFLGQRLAFPIVEDYVKHAWAKFGFECVMLRNDFFLFKFKTQEGMIKVLECGPWFIKSNPMFLKIWVPNTRLEKEKITKVPVWFDCTTACIF